MRESAFDGRCIYHVLGSFLSLIDLRPLVRESRLAVPRSRSLARFASPLLCSLPLCVRVTEGQALCAQ